jgi:predicted ATP-grasp superfamily ATP-dependent carboligase/protein-tyrosine-phosphatase
MALTGGMTTGKVLVLGDDSRGFLSVVRSLGRAGLEIHVAWCPANAPSLRSRYVHAVHRLTGYRRTGTAWLAALMRLLEEERFDLVIPCHDAGLLLLQTHRAELEKLPGIYLLGAETFDICFSKARTYDLAERLSIPVPRQRLATNRAEMDAAAAEFGFPLVLKPCASAGLENPSARMVVRKVWRREELDEEVSSERLKQGILAQENFVGTGVGVEALCHNGEVLTAFQHERVHEPLMGGGSSYRKSVALDEELLNAAQKLMAALRYTGVVMVEFKVNLRTRQWILVEINSRFWGSLPLSIAAGIDFPLYLYEMLIFGRVEFPREYRLGVYARNWLKDLRWMLENLRADRSDPALMTQPLWKVAGSFLNPLLLRESSDTLTLDDPAPALAEVAQTFQDGIWPRLELACRPRGGLRKRAILALQGARHILFVCKGNICRSPFAERALRLSGFDGDCASAGFYPVAGRPSPDVAIEAAAGFGVDLRLSRSRILDDSMVEAADVIFLFDHEHRAAMAASFPAALEKTHFLGALDREGPLEIADPYGHGIEKFERTYGRIVRLVESAAFK